MRKIFLLLCLIGLYAGIAHAQPPDNGPNATPNAAPLDLSVLGTVPILHEGRIKPLDSFARAELELLSGQDHQAMAWLTEVLFDPPRAESRRVIKVTNPEVRATLGLENRESRLYSYTELSRALAPKQNLILKIVQAEEKDWTPQQRALVTTQKHITILQNLMSSLTAFLPLSVMLPETVTPAFQDYSGKRLSYAKTQDIHAFLQETLKGIIKDKGDKIGTYTPAEQALTQLSYTITLLKEAGRASTLFTVIPQTEETWITPWQALKTAPNSQALQYWHDLADAYHDQDTNRWKQAAQALRTHHTARTDVRSDALTLEYYYNHLRPFTLSFALCLIALAALLLSLFIPFKPIPAISTALMSGSLLLQITGIGMRMVILQRPPVSTLYETVLFVSACVMVYVLIMFAKDRKTLWLWLGAILSVFLHIVGFSHDQEGDSMLVLTAVLNTNFWLATHVLCITVGYAFCAITALLAHYGLIRSIREKRLLDFNTALFKNIQTAALLALFFATIGTVLGGIWADQSWGRFWGWDPKENGALLIVLWLVWILHGRISGQLRMLGVLCGLSLLSIILALSWFGVNLLSVGLHAYGFTDSAAVYLGIFMAAETLFVAGGAFMIRPYLNTREKRHA